METPGVGLSFSGFTYEELRAMVYDTDLRDLTTAQNRWGLFKRSIDERIGLLHVLIAQIQPAWRGEAGQAAVAAFQQYVDWLTAVSEVAAQNRETLGDLHTAQTQAILAMRELDAQEGGPAEVVRDPNSLDEPLPPRLADRRQPRAVEIVNDLFQAWLRAYSNIETPPPPNRYVNRQWTPPRVESTSETFSNEKISTFSGREDNSSTNDSQPANSSPIPPFNDREFTGGDPQPDEPLPDITPHPPFNPGPILSGPGGVTPGGATPTPPTTSPPVGVSPPGIGGPPPSRAPFLQRFRDGLLTATRYRVVSVPVPEIFQADLPIRVRVPPWAFSALFSASNRRQLEHLPPLGTALLLSQGQRQQV